MHGANLIEQNKNHRRVKSDPGIPSRRDDEAPHATGLPARVKKSRSSATTEMACVRDESNHLHLNAGSALRAVARLLGADVQEIDAEAFKARLKTYLAEFQHAAEGDACHGYASDTQRELLACISSEQLARLIESVELYGGAKDEPTRWQAFCERYLFDVNGAVPSGDLNDRSLGCSKSHFRRQAAKLGLLQPADRPAWCMATLVKNGRMPPVKATVLTVAAPALDNTRQPEWSVYVDMFGKLKQRPYAVAMKTIAGQFMQCADRHPSLSHVALCAAGMDAFLGGLAPAQQAVARKVGAVVYAELIVSLRVAGKTPQFLGGKNDAFWKEVNAKLQALEEPPVGCLGLVPRCITAKVAARTLIGNAGDLSSLTGNGCARDRSLDGFFGRSSLMHFVHGLVSIGGNSRAQRAKPRKRWSLPLFTSG